jgi:hypothetical protein
MVASLNLSMSSSLVLLLIAFCTLSHWFGCMWWLIAVLETFEESWVVKQTSITDLINQPMAVSLFVLLLKISFFRLPFFRAELCGVTVLIF